MNYFKEAVILLLGPYLILLCRGVSSDQVSMRSLKEWSKKKQKQIFLTSVSEATRDIYSPRPFVFNMLRNQCVFTVTYYM